MLLYITTMLINWECPCWNHSSVVFKLWTFKVNHQTSTHCLYTLFFHFNYHFKTMNYIFVPIYIFACNSSLILMKLALRLILAFSRSLWNISTIYLNESLKECYKVEMNSMLFIFSFDVLLNGNGILQKIMVLFPESDIQNKVCSRDTR